MNKQTIDLDVITGGVPQVLHVAQYDTGARTLEFNIYSSNNDLDLTGATAKISGRKADGLGFEYPATITDRVVVADCTDQMTAVAGIVECAITLMNSEGQIQTARFDLNVKPAPLNDDTVISDSDFPLIEQAIEAEGKAEEYAEEAEAWAVGTKNGEPVPVDDPTYENNAKYWAKQAEQTDIGQVNEEISDIVNVYGSKNLNSYPYYETTKTQNGITFTDNVDGTITVNGTASSTVRFNCHSRSLGETNDLIIQNGKYILSGCPSGGTESTYRLEAHRTHNGSTNTLGIDTGNGILFTANGDDYSPNEVSIQIQIVVQSGQTVSNLTFRPMLRLASIEDDTYVPYVPTNKTLHEEKASWKANGVLGAKNLIPYPYYETTKTQNGVTFTDNGDGTITANGTATATSTFVMYGSTHNNTFPVDVGNYILSGCPSGGSSTTYAMRAKAETSPALNVYDYGDGVEFEKTVLSQLGVYIYIYSGATVNNLTFKPMLRLAEDTDDTYQPYAMTNYELTQKIADLQAQINALI